MRIVPVGISHAASGRRISPERFSPLDLVSIGSSCAATALKCIGMLQSSASAP